MIHLAIFASGSGSNAENIIQYFRVRPESGIKVALIVCNNPQAGVIERADRLHVPIELISRADLVGSHLLSVLSDYKTDYLILAGFLLLIPASLIQAYPDKIVNIHPALLPRYGGKGMYGMNVHEAVLAAGESETGISIHLVNEKYDEGKIIFQGKVEVRPEYSASDIAAKIHILEQEHFPKVIEQFILGNRE